MPMLSVEPVTFPPIAMLPVSALTSARAAPIDTKKHMLNAAMKHGDRFMAASYFGFGVQSELVVVPVAMVEPVTLPPIETAFEFAVNVESFVAGGSEEKKYTNAPQSPVTAATSPPPSHPRTC